MTSYLYSDLIVTSEVFNVITLLAHISTF